MILTNTWNATNKTMEPTATNKFKLFAGRNNNLLSHHWSKLGTHDAIVGSQSQVELLDFNLILTPSGIQIRSGQGKEVEYLDVDNGQARGGLTTAVWKKPGDYKEGDQPVSWTLNAIEKGNLDPFFFMETQSGEIKPRLVAKSAKPISSAQVLLTDVVS